MIIQSKLIPNIISKIVSDEIDGFTFFGIIFVRDKTNKALVQHELIHRKQWIETLFIGFIIIYVFDYLRGLLKYRDSQKAYTQIRFEQEAEHYRIRFEQGFEHLEDWEYFVEHRPLFNWRNFKV